MKCTAATFRPDPAALCYCSLILTKVRLFVHAYQLICLDVVSRRLTSFSFHGALKADKVIQNV